MTALIEAAVESLSAALAAERAGVDRIELCDNLDDGGITPSAELIDAVLGQVRIPVVVMVRPRAGDFVYTNHEVDVMRRRIGGIARHRVAGIVSGAATPEGRIDVNLTRRLIDAAGGLPMTFHRAFDVVSDPHEALDELVELGIARILTSGGAPNAASAMARIADVVSYARGRITIIAGGGIRANNARELIHQTGVRELHSRFVSEAGMRKLVDTVAAGAS